MVDPVHLVPTSASALQASLDVRAVFGRLRRRLGAVAARGDLTPSQASVLRRLTQAGASTASALAAAEGVRPQSMAATVAALEQRGLVLRAPDPGDGRRQLVEPTDAGRDEERGNRDARQEWLTRAMQERLTEEERATVVAAMALLERLVEE